MYCAQVGLDDIFNEPSTSPLGAERASPRPDIPVIAATVERNATPSEATAKSQRRARGALMCLALLNVPAALYLSLVHQARKIFGFLCGTDSESSDLAIACSLLSRSGRRYQSRRSYGES